MVATTKLKKIPENAFQECFESRKRRMHKCFQVEGDYFKGILLWHISIFFNKVFITPVLLLFGHTSYSVSVSLNGRLSFFKIFFFPDQFKHWKISFHDNSLTRVTLCSPTIITWLKRKKTTGPIRSYKKRRQITYLPGKTRNGVRIPEILDKLLQIQILVLRSVVGKSSPE